MGSTLSLDYDVFTMQNVSEIDHCYYKNALQLWFLADFFCFVLFCFVFKELVA